VTDVQLVVRCFSRRLLQPRAGIRLQRLSLVLVVALLPGCLGVFGSDGTSVSIGSHSKGVLLHGVAIPFEGTGYEVHPDWRSRNHRYATDEVAHWLTEIFREIAVTLPGSRVTLGDLSAQGGGGAAMHRSHMSGRDIDIFYFASDSNNRPMNNLPAMFHFKADGSISRWSPGKNRKPIKEPLPDARFDVKRNLAVVRAMLTNPTVQVQWIFIHRDLGALLVAEAEREGLSPALLDRVRAVFHQPTDSQPHDDHMHVRVFCDPGDRISGCSDKGPRRWLKKHWKYMEPKLLAFSDRL
jgi:penicillin-insensitive murein endopeptidase